MNAPFFSLIIPTFNARKKLPAAIDSILSQVFTDLEIVIMDGGSLDGSVELVRAYAEKDERVKLVSEKDNGIYDAMNKGISMAKGQWLYFLGSDDKLYDDQVLLQIKKAISASDCQVIYGNVFSEKYNRAYDGEFSGEMLYQRNICHQAIFMHRSVFDVIGRFKTVYISHADWDHNILWFYHPQIKKTYVDLVIAFYSDGGYSSVNEDHAFDYDKDFTFLRQAGTSIGKPTKSAIYLSIAIKRKREKRFGSFWYYKLKFWLTKYA